MRNTILPIALLVNMAATAQEQFKELDYTPSQSTFTLNAPTKARAVKVRIYDSAQAPQPVKTLNLRRAGEDRWSASTLPRPIPKDGVKTSVHPSEAPPTS